MRVEFDGKRLDIIEEILGMVRGEVQFRCDRCGGFLRLELKRSNGDPTAAKNFCFDVTPCENCCK